MPDDAPRLSLQFVKSLDWRSLCSRGTKSLEIGLPWPKGSSGVRSWILTFRDVLLGVMESRVKDGCYCFDLLCRLTFSAVRRIRFLISACSLRARDSVSPTTTSVAPIRKATSARASHRAPSLELMGVTPRVPRSSGGKVGRGAEVVGFFTNWLRCHKGELPFDTEICVLRPRFLWKSLWKLCTQYNPKIRTKNGTQRCMSKKSESHK